VGLLSERRVLIGSDEGAFAIRDELGELSAPDWDDNTLVQISAEFVADVGVTVLTGDQFGPFEVTARSHDGPPALPDASWEDVVEFSARTTGPLNVGELVNYDPSTRLADRPGRYRVRVSARGRGTSGTDEDGEPLAGDGPVEWYLIDAWEADEAPPQVIRLTSAHARSVLDGGPKLVEVPEMAAGLEAARRVGRDVDRLPEARELSGRVGSAHVERTLAGTRRKLFRSFAYVTNWSQWAVEGSSWTVSASWTEEPYPLHHPDYAFADDHEDQLSGRHGGIRTQFIEVDAPRRVVRQWDWVARVRPGDFITEWEPVLPHPTYATFEFTQRKNPEGQAETTVRLDHADLPVEWVEDMTAWWQFQFAIADLNSFGTRR